VTCKVGVDISKMKLDAAWLRADGKYRSKVFTNNASGFADMLRWLDLHLPGGKADAHVCMEATGTYHEGLAFFLHDQAVAVSVVNPLQVKRFMQLERVRNKTDEGDAKALARFCDKTAPALWEAPSVGVRSLQALVARLSTLQELRQGEANRLAVAHDAVKPSLTAVIASLDESIRDVRKQIRKTIDDDPDLQQRSELLASIPGLGDKTIPPLLAYIGRPERFTSVKALIAYASLTPMIREVRARVESRLGFRVGGKIVKRQAEVGQRVKAGQVLAQLDPQDYRLAADAARAQVAAAPPTATSRPPTSSATRTLREQNFISGAELERRETTLKAAQAQLEQAQAQLSVAGQPGRYATWSPTCPAWSPPSKPSPGQVVTAGTPVVRIAQDGRATWCSRCPKTRWRRSSPAPRSRCAPGPQWHRAGRQGPRSGRQRRPGHAHLRRQGLGSTPPSSRRWAPRCTWCRRPEHGGCAGDQAADQRAAPGRAGHGRVGAGQGHHDGQARSRCRSPRPTATKRSSPRACSPACWWCRRRARAVAGPEGRIYQEKRGPGRRHAAPGARCRASLPPGRRRPPAASSALK
jgi:transposase